jgi:D-alanyl-D-alanine carboxypeptidase
MKTLIVFLSLTVFISTQSLFPIFSCGDQEFLQEQLQKVLDSGLKKHNARGVSVAVIFPDGKIWTGVSGISHEAVSIKPDMLFAIGSITKNFVASLTLKLAEEGFLSLDDPLSKWLPSYPNIDGNITIRQLLNHTSGIYKFLDNQTIWDDMLKDMTQLWTPEEVLSYIKQPYFAPGCGFHYSNTNYLLMAMIIKKATGSNLSTEFKKYFWKPLGIKNAYLAIDEDIPDNQAHIYGDNFMYGEENSDVTFLPRAAHDSIIYGSGGLFMTAEDLARWCHALFEGKVLQPRSMDDMLQFVKTKSVPNMRAYGLGVQVFKREFSSGEEAIGHGGANIGTTVYMVHLPEHHLSVVVMVNAFPTKSIDVITKGVIKVVLKELDVIGLIPYFSFFPYGFIMLCAAISITTLIMIRVNLIVRLKHKRRLIGNHDE